jgi:hypothetical protein
MKRSSLFLVVLALGAGPLAMVACGGDNPEPNTPKTTSSASASVSASTSVDPIASEIAAASASATPSATVAPLPALTVDDKPNSDDPKPAPTAKILAPSAEQSIGDVAKAKDFVVKLDVKNWKLSEGQHVHVIIDDLPYFRYEGKTPLKISDIIGSAELTEGQHVMHVFPSRPSHESVKTKGASSMVTFWVGKKDPKATPIIVPKKPHLVYSRPKGKNEGGMAKNLMIDFYLVGTDLTDGNKVRYTVTGPGAESGLTGTFDKWAPKVVHNARKGDYTVKLELLDKDGKLVEGSKLNAVERKISVDPDAADSMAMSMSMGGAPASSAAPAASASAKK